MPQEQEIAEVQLLALLDIFEQGSPSPEAIQTILQWDGEGEGEHKPEVWSKLREAMRSEFAIVDRTGRVHEEGTGLFLPHDHPEAIEALKTREPPDEPQDALETLEEYFGTEPPDWDGWTARGVMHWVRPKKCSKEPMSVETAEKVLRLVSQVIARS
jgi:hypothetical protein